MANGKKDAMMDEYEYEYDKNHRPTFPSDWQWEQFQNLQRVRFWMWMFVGILSIFMFGLDIWQAFSDGVGRDFIVGVVFGTGFSYLTLIVTRPHFIRWATRPRKWGGGTR